MSVNFESLTFWKEYFETKVQFCELSFFPSSQTEVTSSKSTTVSKSWTMIADILYCNIYVKGLNKKMSVNLWSPTSWQECFETKVQSCGFPFFPSSQTEVTSSKSTTVSKWSQILSIVISMWKDWIQKCQ